MRAVALAIVLLCGVARADVVVVVDPAMAKDRLANARAAVARTKLRVASGKTLGIGLEAAHELVVGREGSRVVVVSDGSTRLGLRAATAKLSADHIPLRRVASGFDDVDRLARLITDEATRPEPPPRTFAYVFVIDASSSMKGAGIESAKEIVRMLIEILDPQDLVAVVTIGDETGVLVELQRAANRVKIASQVARIETYGFSRLADGMKIAREVLAQSPATNEHVVVVTAGHGGAKGVGEELVRARGQGHHVLAIGAAGAQRDTLSAFGAWHSVEEPTAIAKLVLRR